MLSNELRVEVTEASAQRCDARSVKTLLEGLPTLIARDLRNQLASAAGGFAGMRYEEETRRAFWIAADGKHLLCITLPSVTQEQADEISVEIKRRHCSGDTVGVVTAYGTVVGADLRLARYH
jgi:hypothetical protein